MPHHTHVPSSAFLRSCLLLFLPFLLRGGGALYAQEPHSTTPQLSPEFLLLGAADSSSYLEGYSRFSIGIAPEGYRLPSEGESQKTLRFDAKGQRTLGSLRFRGTASYTRQWTEASRGSISAHPEWFYPYIMMDSLGHNTTAEVYALAGSVGYVFPYVDLALGASFRGGTRYSQKDPRLRNREGNLELYGAVALKTAWYRISAQGEYQKYLESSHVKAANPDRVYTYYYLLGGGEYDHGASVAPISPSVGFRHYRQHGRGKVELAPATRNLPKLWGAGEYAIGYMETQWIDRQNELQSHSLSLGIEEQVPMGKHLLIAELSYSLGQRIGEEIFYDTASTSSQLFEEREYAREKRYQARRRHFHSALAYRYTVGANSYAIRCTGEHFAFRSLYPLFGHRAEGDAAQGGLELQYARKVEKLSYSIGAEGHYRRNLSLDARLSQGKSFIHTLSMKTVDYYLCSRYDIGLRLDVAYRLPMGSELLLQLWGAYLQAEHHGWLGNVSLGYRF